MTRAAVRRSDTPSRTDRAPAERLIRGIATAVPLLLVCAAEGAWISVLAGMIHEFALRDPVVGLPAFAAMVLAGAVVGAILTGRLGPRWPPIAMGLVVVAAIAGVLVAPESRAALARGGLDGAGVAIGANPGGLLAGLALLRGFSHATWTLREETVARLLGGGLVGITLLALVGSFVADPWRSRFIADAESASLVFALAAIFALAFTRQRLIGLQSHVDWHRNPAWVALMVLVVGVVVVLAVPAAAVAPQAITLALALVIGPIVIIGVVAGWTRSSIRLAIGAFVLYALYTILNPGSRSTITPPPSSGIGASEPPPGTDQTFLLAGGAIVTILATIGVLVLIRLWMRQISTDPVDVDEVRTIDRGGPAAPRPRRRLRLPFGRGPHDAVAAYRALMADLEPAIAVRRSADETPLEHATRLRAAGLGGLSLELLAADYALVRFGERPLSEREDRRAIDRWRRLRRALRGVAVSLPEPGEDQRAPVQRG